MYLTQWHIDRAKEALTENKKRCSFCPLALMFEDYFNGSIEVSFIFLYVRNGDKVTTFRMSNQMVDVIEKFDFSDFIVPQHFTQPLKFIKTV